MEGAFDSHPANPDARLARFWRDPASENACELGDVLLAAGRHEECRQVAAAALRHDAGDTALRLLFARACFTQRDLLRAQAVLLAILEDEPRHAAACRLLGQVFLKRGDPERACRALERASRLSTEDDPELQRLQVRAQRLLAIASGEYEAERAPAVQPSRSVPAEPHAPEQASEPEPSQAPRLDAPEVPDAHASGGRGKAVWLLVAVPLLVAAAYAGWRYGLRPVSDAAAPAAHVAEPAQPESAPEPGVSRQPSAPAAPQQQPPAEPESTPLEEQIATREAWLQRIREALEADAPDALDGHPNEAEETDPVLGSLARGVRSALAGDEESAHRHLGAIGSDDGLALATLRARAALRLSDEAFLEESQQVLQRALKAAEEPSSKSTSLVTRLRARRARLVLEAGRPEDALSLLEPVVKPASRDASLLTLYGDVLYALDRVDAAAGAYNRALEIDPERPEALLGRARTEARAGKHGAAVARLRRLMEVLPDRGDPRRAQASTLLGRALLQRRGKGDRERARELLDRAAEQPGAPVEVYFWQGEAHAGRHVGKAIQAYRRYLQAAPEGEYARRAERALRR